MRTRVVYVKISSAGNSTKCLLGYPGLDDRFRYAETIYYGPNKEIKYLNLFITIVVVRGNDKRIGVKTHFIQVSRCSQ